MLVPPDEVLALRKATTHDLNDLANMPMSHIEGCQQIPSLPNAAALTHHQELQFKGIEPTDKTILVFPCWWWLRDRKWTAHKDIARPTSGDRVLRSPASQYTRNFIKHHGEERGSRGPLGTQAKINITMAQVIISSGGCHQPTPNSLTPYSLCSKKTQRSVFLRAKC